MPGVMAIFEKPSQTKPIVDDTEELICTVESAQNINKHTEYILRVQRGPSKENKWNVSRRYRDFAALHASLQQANIDLPLPPKKLIGNMQPSFIAERQIALQQYINEVLKHPILAQSLQVRSFLDPTNYSSALAEQALQTVSIALRGDGRYELKGPLLDIGWRPRKHYFLVSDVESKTNCMLSWQTYGPDRVLDDRDLQTVFKSLQNLSHPYIDQILAIHNLETGAYVVRRIHENGSLRDILYGTDYTKNHLAKYGNPKVRKPLTLGQIAHYGHQILLALKFLHDNEFAHGHLHPGNIAIQNQQAVLLDIENVVVGASHARRSQLLGLKCTSAEAVDVYSFGRTLYEMAFAEEPPDLYVEDFPDHVNEDLVSVLRMCLSRTCGRGVGLQALLSAPLFAGGDSAPRVRLPAAVHPALACAAYSAYLRMRSDRKLAKNAKREVRIKEILSSEEEMKKQKRRAKKRDSVWKSTSSLAETLRSRSASTASSPTPPALPPESSANGSSSPPTSSGRSALLDAICAFDKGRLARVTAR